MKFWAAFIIVSFYAISPVWAEGPISQYCHLVRSQLKKSWIPSPTFGPATSIDIEVDSSGHIDAIQPGKYNQGATVDSETAMTFLKTIGKLDALPDAVPQPIWLTAQFGKELDDLDVTWRDGQFMDYMRTLQTQIKHHWFPPKNQPPTRVVLSFKIHSSGEMTDLKLATKSGVDIIDNGALSAATNAAPFAPLPDGASDSVSIQFTLDINQHPGI